MPKASHLVPIGVDAWLALSFDGTILERIRADGYSLAYGSLRRHFSKLSSITWDDAVLGLHVVYGWMPTIPKLSGIMQWTEQRKQLLTQSLTNVARGIFPGDDELNEATAFCNNSIVGASKLLHFLNPALFAIWDSRVAKAFFNRRKVYAGQVNSIAAWKVYQTTLKKWLKDPRVVQRCQEFRKVVAHLDQVTDLRLIELVLFHDTAPRRAGRNN